MGFIYLLTFANGRGYVGQTTQRLSSRMAQHRRDRLTRRTVLYAAWAKYGEPALLSLGEYPNGQLDRLEIAMIEVLRTQRPGGYNITEGGGRPLMANETRAKIGAALRGRKQPPAATARRAEALRGRKHSAQTIAKRAEAALGGKRTPEQRRRMAAAHRARWAAYSPARRAEIGRSITEGKKRGTPRD